ncbi:hypothetical protein [Paludibacterium denitrificans]|uniref:Flagellar protein FliT n=1 Tax=Paludibacterium denitrificans TaxID=2675226 RepID=A0A844GC96_9NEIS|nr:hypothetical protein [Paludibacterium denitrificans]MTD32921.1 hypothetical protein [Paludibacterium denitrificans]HJV05944.1 hypothetical protein [Chromobacteriaceae bacterium]
MANTRRLLTLADRLIRAVNDCDWKTVEATAQAVAVTATRLSARPALTQPEQDAVAQVLLAHQYASRRCAVEARDLAEKLCQLRRNAEGYIAYALTTDASQDE